jgi:hypothetical protein
MAGKCESCSFYEEYAGDTTGECHKSPPRAHPDTRKAMWPPVKPTDWCGKYEKEASYDG